MNSPGIPVQLVLFERDGTAGRHASTPDARGDAGIDVGDLFQA